MTSTMPRARATATIAEVTDVIETEVEVSQELSEQIEREEIATEQSPAKPEKRFATFLDYEGKPKEVELVDKDAFFWAPGATQKFPISDYFFNTTDKPTCDIVPKFKMKSLGTPCMSEMLNEVFHDYFKPNDGFLLYKYDLQEVYSVIIPLKYTKYSKNNGNVDGDIQVHAISFMLYGSVNIDLFKKTLEKVSSIVGYKK